MIVLSDGWVHHISPQGYHYHSRAVHLSTPHLLQCNVWAVTSCTELCYKQFCQPCKGKATIFIPEAVAEGQGANSLCCHSYICKRLSDQNFKSIPSHGIDILLRGTRQCLSPFKIKNGAWCLKLCLIVLACLLFLLFLCQLLVMTQEAGVRALDKDPFTSCLSAEHPGIAGTVQEEKTL